MSEKAQGIYAKDGDGQFDDEDVMASWKGFWREKSELETEKSQLAQKKKEWLATSHSTGVDPRYLDDEISRVAAKLRDMDAELKNYSGNECRQTESVADKVEPEAPPVQLAVNLAQPASVQKPIATTPALAPLPTEIPEHTQAFWGASASGGHIRDDVPKTYNFPMFERLKPVTEFRGGYLALKFRGSSLRRKYMISNEKWPLNW